MEEGALNCDSGLGTLTVNGVLLNTPAWCAYDLSPCLDEAEVRGGDKLIPHTVGVLARRRRRTVTRRDFPLIITGLFNAAGVRQANTGQGLIDNVTALKAGLGIADDAPAGVTGTVTAVWTQPGGATKSAAVHVIGLRHTVPSLHIRIAQVVLSLSFPAGIFA